MAHTALAIPQLPADCRWGRPWPQDDVRSADLQTAPQASPRTWTCVHDTPHMVYEEECRTCPHWEPAAAGHAGALVVSESTASRGIGWFEVLTVSTRAVIVLTAVLFIALGLSILSSLWAIPVTVAFWLSAAALAAYGLVGPLPGPDRG